MRVVPLLRSGGERGFAQGVKPGFPYVPNGFVAAIIRFWVGVSVILFHVYRLGGEGGIAQRIGQARCCRRIKPLYQRIKRILESGRTSLHRVRRRACARIKPPQMRQQQPRIKPPPLAHRLTPKPDRFGDAVNRAVGQDLLDLLARMDQRRIPQPGKHRITPPLHVNRLCGHPHRLRRNPHIAVQAERMEKAPHAGRGEGIVIADKRQRRKVVTSPGNPISRSNGTHPRPKPDVGSQRRGA